jgi:hypothetical protein
MTTVRDLVVLPLVFLGIVAGSAAAGPALAGQEHIVTPGQMTAAMTQKLASEDADRAAVHQALARPEVHNVASTMGVDLERVNAAVDTMSGANLEQAASTARQVNQQLVGGASTVVLSTTTIIIILLAVILIVVIAK